jgi:hypothetical protein
VEQQHRWKNRLKIGQVSFWRTMHNDSRCP